MGQLSSAEIAESRIVRGGICGQSSLQTGGFQQKCQIVYHGIWISFYYCLHWICCYYGSHSLIQGIYYVRDHMKKPGLYVGGKMVHYMTRLWRLVSVIGIHCYYRRMRIPS